MGWATMTKSGNILLVSRPLMVLLFFSQLRNYVECLAEDSPETVFCQQFVRSKGYLCEEHKMYTEDGFELLLHRVGIPDQSAGGSDKKQGDSQYNLKVALSHRMRKKKESNRAFTSEVKRADSRKISEVVFRNHDFVSERDQPFQQFEREQPFEQFDLGKTQSDSRPRHREPRRMQWPRSTDERDLPENVPLSLPPLSVEYPATKVDPQMSSSQPLGTLEQTLLPTTTAINPYTTFGPPADFPFSAKIPTAAPFWSEPSETQSLSPEASTVAVPPLWYIPGVTQRPVQSGPSDVPVSPLQSDGPLAPIFSPELPHDHFIPPETLSPAPCGLETISEAVHSCGQLPEPIDQPQPLLGPVVPDLTTISTAAPSLPELLPYPVFPEPFSGAPSGPEIPGQLQEPIDQSSSYLGPVVPGDLPLVAPPPSYPIEWVEPSLGPEEPASGTAAAPVEAGKRCRPVLLLHHELLNGDMWFTEVTEDGSSPLLPFVLVDDGFDVWVGHERATYWSHDHTNLDSSEQEYWDWTWDEFVNHDLPIMLTHINANTHSRVHVVGFSQSAAVAVAASAQEAVASLVKSLVLVGPSIYHGSVTGHQLQSWVQLFAKFIDTTRPDPSLFSGQFNISRNFGLHNWSLGGPVSLITGPDCCISKSLTLFDNGWDGTTSYKNFQHFEQGVLTNAFQRFDYGSASRNLEAYGQITPTAYAPENVPADLPVQVIYAGNDFFCPPDGAQKLFLAMQKIPVKVYLPLYAHFDLLYSSSRYQDVYLPILSFLRDSAQAT